MSETCGGTDSLLLLANRFRNLSTSCWFMHTSFACFYTTARAFSFEILNQTRVKNLGQDIHFLGKKGNPTDR